MGLEVKMLKSRYGLNQVNERNYLIGDGNQSRGQLIQLIQECWKMENMLLDKMDAQAIHVLRREISPDIFTAETSPSIHAYSQEDLEKYLCSLKELSRTGTRRGAILLSELGIQ